VDCVNSKKLRERGYSPPLTPLPAPTPCVPSVERLRLAIVQVWLSHRLASLPRIAFRHCRNSFASSPDISHPTSYLPSHRSGFAARPSLRSLKRRRCYEGSDSRRSHVARRVSPLTPLCLPTIQLPTTRSVRWSLYKSPQRHQLFQASPSSSGLATGSRRIGFVILQTGGSPPAAPHPTSRRRSCLRLTQLRHTMTGTYTPPTKRPHRRTG
jgi:hypothetical protein